MGSILDKQEISDAVQSAFEDVAGGVRATGIPLAISSGYEEKKRSSESSFADTIKSIIPYGSPEGKGILMEFKAGHGYIFQCASQDPPGWDTKRFIEEGYVPWAR